MGLLKKGKAAGQKFTGALLELLQELRFTITSNPELDSQGGSFLWKIITGAVNSWRLRDDVKGQDIIIVDTVNDTVEILPPYIGKNFFPPNEGQVKIEAGNLIKPVYVWGGITPVGTWQKIIYASPLTLAPSPTTQFPQNIAAPADSDLYDFVNTTFIENTILGQVNVWRLILNYSGKASNIAAGIDFRLENTVSGFMIDAVATLPRTSTSGTIVLNAVTIADGQSLPAPFGTGQGYVFSLNSTDPITIEVESVTRLNYQKNLR